MSPRETTTTTSVPSVDAPVSSAPVDLRQQRPSSQAKTLIERRGAPQSTPAEPRHSAAPPSDRLRRAATRLPATSERSAAPAPSPTPTPTTVDPQLRGRTSSNDSLSDLLDRGRALFEGRTRTGGVAPSIRPRTAWDRFREGRLLERRGFVPLTPGRSKRRHRILPRTVIGISFMLLALSVGVAFAGAGFYAYYDNRLAANEEEIAQFVEGFDAQFVDASNSINELRGDSLEQIRDELQPLGEYVSEQNGVVNLPDLVGPSVYQLRTANERGAPVAGTAAAVAKHPNGTVFVTSYSLVKSSTIRPSPAIELLKGEETIPATLWSWDPDRDLALVIVEAEVPTLEFATEEQLVSSIGLKIFAMSGTGGQGSTASPGTVLDRSEAGYQHTAAVGELFNGGPLVSSDGKLMGIASTSYAPLGFAGGDVRFAPDLTGLCARLLNCADPVEPEAADPDN